MDFCQINAKIEMLRTGRNRKGGKLGSQKQLIPIFLTLDGILSPTIELPVCIVFLTAHGVDKFGGVGEGSPEESSEGGFGCHAG
jgi:hypothetical protein